MLKSYKFFIGFLLFLLAVLIYFETSAPPPVNWQKTYSIKDKIPYGNYIFYQHLKNQSKDLKLVEKSPYELMKNDSITGSYIFINQNLVLGEETTALILNWIEKGNTLLISAEKSNFFNLDTLQTKQNNEEYFFKNTTYEFYNEKLKTNSSYIFDRNTTVNFFEEIDTLQQTALGKINIQKNQEEINFLKIPYGKGKLLLHTSPETFSNYFLLKENNHEYAEKILAYLDLEKTLNYDVYHDRNYNFPKYYDSPLYVILGNKYLKWGYYFLLIGGFLYILFEGKRKQKAIPIITPLENKSYQYIRSIAGLYLDKKDHTTITHKQIKQFLDFIKTHLRVEIKEINSEIINQLNELTAISKEEIIELFEEIKYLQQKSVISKKELLSLHKKINRFKKNI